jgi:hypothetical protein
VRPPVARNGGRRSFGWGGSDVAPDVVSLRVRTGKMAEEMRTRERTRKGKESVAFAHGLGGEDASTTADVRDSGEQLCFSPAAILPEIRGERGRRWLGRTGCGWGSRLVSGYRGEVGGIGAASVTRGEKKLPELMMLTGGSHLSLVAEGREGGAG